MKPNTKFNYPMQTENIDIVFLWENLKIEYIKMWIV